MNNWEHKNKLLKKVILNNTSETKECNQFIWDSMCTIIDNVTNDELEYIYRSLRYISHCLILREYLCIENEFKSNFNKSCYFLRKCTNKLFPYLQETPKNKTKYLGKGKNSVHLYYLCDKPVAVKSFDLFDYYYYQELNSIYQIKEHENITKILCTWSTKKRSYISFEYYNTDFYQHFKIFNKMIIKKALFELLTAVHFVHSIGVCHRDIKPQNIMFSNGILKLCDWDNSIHFDLKNPEEINTLPICSLYYRSPELFKLPNEYNGKHLDLWSVGCVFYEMVTGYDYYNNKIDSFIYKMSNFANDLLVKLLEKDPLKRFTATQALNHNYFK
jgi:serine/threonine protein kinase